MSDTPTPRRRRGADAQAAAEAQAAADGALRKGNEKDATSNVPQQPAPRPASTAATRVSRKKLAKAAAAEQAEKDARLRADTTPPVVMPKGRPLTLHEQNLLARARDKELRDIALTASKAAGKAAYDVLVEKVGPDAVKARRFRALGSAEKLMLDARRRAEAEQAAKG